MAKICNLFDTYSGGSSVTASTSVGSITTIADSAFSKNAKGNKTTCSGYDKVPSNRVPSYCKCLEYYGYKYDSTGIGSQATTLTELPYWYKNNTYTQRATPATVGISNCNGYNSGSYNKDANQVEKWTIVQSKCHLYSMPRVSSQVINIGKDIVDTYDLNEIYTAIKKELSFRDISMSSNLDNKTGKKITPDILQSLIDDLKKSCLSAYNPGTLNDNTSFLRLPKDVEEGKIIKTSQILDVLTHNYETVVSDCLCYADCNSYSVCWCYGNCNYY